QQKKHVSKDALTQFKTLVSFDPNTYKFQLTPKFQFEFDRAAQQSEDTRRSHAGSNVRQGECFAKKRKR
ncbi:MAG: hypothetical protein VXU42_05815, partial [Verrucomicrobiota bacterium]|nr:hypothetical protein [Verrucomicrobiota bacterium]